MRTGPDEWAALERWVMNRDEVSFRSLIDQYGAMVYATCRRIVRLDADAEDLTQECFAVLSGLKKPPKAPLGPWFHRVATNLSLNHLRTQQRRAARERGYSQTVMSEDAAREEAGLYLDQALSGLPDWLRVPVVAHYLEGRSQESIATSAGISRQTVGYRIGKGLDALRKALAREGIAVSVASLGALLGTARAEAVPLSTTLTERLAHLASRAGVSGGAASTTVSHGLLHWATAAVVVCGVVLGAAYAVRTFPSKSVRAAKPDAVIADPAAAASVPKEEPPRAVQEVGEAAAAPETTDTASISGRIYFPGWTASDGSVYVDAVTKRGKGTTRVGWKRVKVGEEYLFEKLPPGDYAIRASLRGAQGSAERTVKPGDGLTGVDLDLVSSNTVICGFCRDPDGQPIAGAGVQLWFGVATCSVQADVVTDRNGYFEIRHVAGNAPVVSTIFFGNYSLHVAKEGYHARYAPGEFLVQKGERFEADVVLVPGCYSLSGRVVTPTGAPAPGAVIGGAGQKTRSGPDGAFRLDRLLDACEVSVQVYDNSPYYKAEPEKYPYRGGSDEDGVVFTAWPGGTVVGRLCSADGAPFPLESLRNGSWREPKTPVIAEGKQYASGTAFEFDGVPPGKSYIMAVADESNAPVLAGPFEVKSGERVDAGDLTFGPGGRIVGRVVFPEDWAWSACSVGYEPVMPAEDLRFRGTGRSVEASPENGFRFELAGLMPGRCKIHYQGGLEGLGTWGLDREVVVEEGQTLTLDLPVTVPPGVMKAREPEPAVGTGVVEGYVLWDNGTPAENASLNLHGRRSKVPNDQAHSDDRGHFRFEGLDPEDMYELRTDLGWGKAEDRREGVCCGSDVRVTFGRTIQVAGRLVGADGRAVCRARFSVVAGGERRALYRSVVGSDGRFTIEDNAAICGDLVIEGTGFAPAVVKDIDVQFGRELNLGDVTVDAGMSFSGSVVDEDGQAIAYAEVLSAPVLLGTKPELWPEHGHEEKPHEEIDTAQRVVTADSRGEFEIPHDQEGGHVIVVTAPGYARLETEGEFRAGSPLSFALSRRSLEPAR